MRRGIKCCPYTCVNIRTHGEPFSVRSSDPRHLKNACRLHANKCEHMKSQLKILNENNWIQYEHMSNVTKEGWGTTKLHDPSLRDPFRDLINCDLTTDLTMAGLLLGLRNDFLDWISDKDMIQVLEGLEHSLRFALLIELAHSFLTDPTAGIEYTIVDSNEAFAKMMADLCVDEEADDEDDDNEQDYKSKTCKKNGK